MHEIDLSGYDAVPARSCIAYRAAQVRAVGEAGEKVYEVWFSNEDPVPDRLMWVDGEWVVGTEILLHGPENVDMEWIGSGNAPFLKDHDASLQAGIISGAELDAGARALKITGLRFSRSALGRDMQADIDDGIRKNVSVGYIVNTVVEVVAPTPESGGVYHVTGWKPVEVSSVAIPAVESVGFGRSPRPEDAVNETILYRMKQSNINEKGEGRMEPETKNRNGGGSAPESVNVTVTQPESDASRIHAIADLHRGMFPDGLELAARAIAENVAVDAFYKDFSAGLRKESERQASVKIGLSEKEKRQFSLLRLLRGLVNKTEEAAYEMEVCDAYASARGSAPSRGGVLVPYEAVPVSTRAAVISTGTGAGVVQEIHSGEVIDYLRDQSVITRAGARMLSGLVGKFDMARIGTGTTAYWVGEVAETGSDITTSSLDLDLLQFAAKTVGVNQGVTRRMMHQTSLDVEAIVRQDIFASLADAIDLAALAGTGSGNQPTGVMYTANVNTEEIATEATPLWADIVNMETAVATDKALSGALAYICHPTAVGNMKQTLKASGVSGYILENGQINGYPYYSTGNALKGAVKSLIFGNWTELMVGMWGGIELLTDPYTYSRKGIVSVTAFQDIDVQLRHPESFCYNTVAP